METRRKIPKKKIIKQHTHLFLLNDRSLHHTASDYHQLMIPFFLFVFFLNVCVLFYSCFHFYYPGVISPILSLCKFFSVGLSPTIVFIAVSLLYTLTKNENISQLSVLLVRRLTVP
ncbi:hypothetical protein K450DRAFT_234100 [Umbelopsis ramanniana AG]|uniref:Uncharacterized protein n=1 Tax=Umbelopsis ramanniana AG TaxID=1314678 RepID=A0AAD5EBQ3_UMBRA|nr:uncharacterized protein K450DRAFT_234100 [Umbelopsis ramanniana AG]KAI8580993.1 hypothetical protein K450DRAFT_234100 [Umbelopsis ramanniana AG]